MMNARNDIVRYIEDPGYRTERDIKAKFSSMDPEILEAMLTNVQSNNVIRKVTFKSAFGSENLYYLVG